MFYAKIVGGVCVGVIDSPAAIADENHVEISSYNLDLVGKQYQKSGNTFIDTEPAPIRKISKGAFRRRLTAAEKVAIKTSTDPVVKVLEDDLLVTSFVDLDFQPLIDGIDYLIAVNILAPERKAELLQDGDASEQ